MSERRLWMVLLFAVCVAAVFTPVPLAAQDQKADPPYTFTSPLFGLSAGGPNGSLLVADAGAGVVVLQGTRGKLVARLPGVTDMAPSTFGMLMITGGGPDESSAKLWRLVKGEVVEIADLGAFEETVNPDAPEVNPNPFDVAALPNGGALVSDAGGNSLVIIDKNGNMDWVATLPVELVSTANVKHLFNCPAGPPNICDLPDMIPGQPVATSIAIGPDGYYYMGELKGFPAPTGASRIWRVNPNARHARCGSSPDCTVIANGFTSIVDLTFGPDGRLHVVELDEASWFAIEVGVGTPLGGTVNACTNSGGTWSCVPEASGLRIPIAAAVDASGAVHVATSALIPGEAEVITLP